MGPERAIPQSAWDAIRDGIDLQVHVAPDVIARRVDDLDLAREFLDAGLRGFVLKSHYFPTAERAAVVRKAAPGIQAHGALTCNHAVGGLNPVAVELAGRAGCKIVWMPTVDAENETAGVPGVEHKKLPFWAEIQRDLTAMGISPPRLCVIGESGCLLPAAMACLELIARHDMVLATGHLGKQEIFALVEAARDLKLRKVLVTHAEFPSQNLTPTEQNELADRGAMIEHCYTTMYTGKAGWDACFEGIRRVGPERSVISTDLGQVSNPPVAQGFAAFAARLLEAGFNGPEIRNMAVMNPSSLLSVEMR